MGVGGPFFDTSDSGMMEGMKRARRVLAGVFLLAGLVSMVLSAAPARASAPGAVVELHLDGVVDPFMANYLSSAISEANDSQAAAVLILIDTPGGLDSSMRE